MNDSVESKDSFKNDPIIQLSLVDKYVKVELIKNCSFEGFVHSYDPFTNSIILSIPKNGDFTSTVIPGHAILNIVEITIPPNTGLPRRISCSATPKDASTRKLKLIEWLKSNLIQVTEDDNRIIFGNVSILPPYSVMDICTDSPMVAMQIKKLIENMPENFNTG